MPEVALGIVEFETPGLEADTGFENRFEMFANQNKDRMSCPVLICPAGADMRSVR